jgi:hypothetical protein
VARRSLPHGSSTLVRSGIPLGHRTADRPSHPTRGLTRHP